MLCAYFLLGSSMYLSPEMIGGCYSYSTDVWSLGVVFYILLSGVYPFESPQGDVEETKEIISRGKYTFPAQHWVGVSLQVSEDPPFPSLFFSSLRLTQLGDEYVTLLCSV